MSAHAHAGNDARAGLGGAPAARGAVGDAAGMARAATGLSGGRGSAGRAARIAGWGPGLLLLIACLFIAPLFAQVPGGVANQQRAWTDSGIIQYLTGSKMSPPLIAALICTLAMALIYMAAAVLSSEELKQFVRAELGQAIVTVLIVICIVGIVTGLDVALERIAGGVVSPCVSVSVPASVASGLTTNKYAYCYVRNLYDLSRQAASDSLEESVDYASEAYTSTGVMTTRWFLLYVGFSMRPNADKRLDSEIKGQEFSLHQTYMASLLGQRYMLEAIAPALGAAALFLGVLLRALFYTRRLGGLLIAAGLGLLLVWPATYLLAWVSLNVAVYGPQAIATPADSTCPDSCKILAPYGYYVKDNPSGENNDASGTKFGVGTLTNNQIQAVASAATTSSNNVAEMLKRGVQPCYPASNTASGAGAISYTDSKNCPSSCRFYPTPADCNITACANLPPACKAIRAINDTAGSIDSCAHPGGANADWACSESTCPAYCKQILPQISEEDGVVVPSVNADQCGKDSDCVQCSLFLRRYNYAGDASTITAVASTNNHCKTCMSKYTDPSKAGGLPDCMTGVPSLLSGSCDAAAACGTHIGLSDWLKLDASKRAGICPVDCRISFGAGQDAYKDPTYVEYCENDAEVAAACNRCPTQCKINATELGAGGASSRSGLAGLSGSISCAEAPKFSPVGSETATMSSDETGNCRLCPLSCRFRDLKLDGNKTPFLSAAHYGLACYYYAADAPSCEGKTLDVCTVKLIYTTPSNANTCPSGWYEYDDTQTVVSGCSFGSLPSAPPRCAPTTQIYLRADDFSSSLCPAYATSSAQFMSSLALSDCEPAAGQPDRPGYLLAATQPNTDASAECATLTAQKYCDATYCPDSCKADRQKDGPFYCSLSDITSANAIINDNAARCPACKSLNAAKSTGPQCQVLLLDESSSKVYFPRGCDAAACAVGTVGADGSITTANAMNGIDPTKTPQPACNGFCFPRLAIPIGGACNAYSSALSTTTLATGTSQLVQYDRAFANGAACPIDCRYDYQGARPTGSAMNRCGDGSVSQPCGDCAYALNASARATCEDANHYNNCTQIRPMNATGYWYRSNTDIVAYNTACPPNNNCTQYNQSMRASGYVFTTGPIYSCSPLHKYPGLDSLLGGGRECGEINASGNNPALNLCNATALPATCQAGYNATTVACQPLVSTTSSPAPSHCLNCPLFCRSEVNGATLCTAREGRGNTGWDRGGSAPVCGDGSSSVCDMRTANSPADDPSFLPGFCGVDSTAFHLEALGEGSCQSPNEGYAAACPARCRIILSDNEAELPAECSTLYADACNLTANLPTYCRAAPASRLCQGCVDCQTDCLAIPLVRQNCQELCLASDYASSGRTDLSAKDLTSSMGGAVGNTAWRNLGNESIAVFVLPIFCILITLSFIRVLSPFLGGDIELPGILKLI